MTKTIKKFSVMLVCAAAWFSVEAASPNTAHATWFDCQPIEIYEFGTRIHVRCSNSIALNGNTVRFVAISNSNANLASRFIAIASAAMLSGKTFVADIPADTATNVGGCQVDCRTPVVFGVKNPN